MVHRSGAGKMPERASFDLGPGWQQVRVTFQDLGTAGEDVVGFLICATERAGSRSRSPTFGSGADRVVAWSWQQVICRRLRAQPSAGSESSRRRPRCRRRRVRSASAGAGGS